MLSFVDVAAIRPLRVVIDAANGMAGAMLPPVLERLPIDAVRCYFEPGRHVPEPRAEPAPAREPRVHRAKTLEERADLGVAFDGDADRCFFVDDTGEFVPGDFVDGAARRVDPREGAGREGHLRRPRELGRAARRSSAPAACRSMNRVGHAFIKHRMREEGAVFGGEVSGHYYFRDFSQADSGVVPFLLMLELVSKRGRKLSELLRPFRERYFITGELNTPVADVALKLQELKERFGREGTVSHLDGISVDADDWHMNVRPSNTEPLLRLNLEARSQELMERKRDEVLEPSIERSSRRQKRPPFKFSAQTRVGFSDTDAQGIVYYGRYLPYFDLARVEYHRHLGLLGMDTARSREFVDARAARRVLRAGAVRRPARGVTSGWRGSAGRASTYELAAYRIEDDVLMVDRDADARARRPRRADARARSRTRTGSDPRVRGRDLEA